MSEHFLPHPAEEPEAAGGWRTWTGFALAPLLLIAVILTSPPEGLSLPGWRAAGVGLVMALLWITEALPIPVTALLPLVLFPLLGIASMKDTSAPYADPVIFLFMGGFMLSLAMQRWNLHKRIALGIVSRVGSRPSSIVLGFLIATAFLSMWVSNAATAVMMLPIAISVAELMRESSSEGNGRLRGFEVALMLAVAYASSIGGMATPIGTPPNAFLVGFMERTYGTQIGFAHFMTVGVPLLVFAIPATWLVLTRLCFRVPAAEVPGVKEKLGAELARMGPMSRGEVLTALAFTLAALLWMFRPLIVAGLPVLKDLSDTSIAMIAAIALFAIPVNARKGIFVLNWKQAAKLPWEVLILFGGGLSLAAALQSTQFAEWLGGQSARLSHLPLWAMVLVVSLTLNFLTELTSNTAVTAAFLPVVGSLAVGTGHPPLLLAFAAALSASCAFMLPVGTPPNAIVFGSGRVALPQMARAGILLNLSMSALITLLTMTLIRWLFRV